MAMRLNMNMVFLALQLTSMYSIETTLTIIKNTEYILQNHDKKIAYLFAHGLGATGCQANMYSKQFSQHPYPESPFWILASPLVIFNFPDAKNDNAQWHSDKVNLGQQMDIDALCQAYNKTREQLPNHDVVLFGVSRGATTIFNALANYSFEGLRAVVLESPFDTISNVIGHLMNQYYLGWVPFSKHIGLAIMQKKFPSIDLNGIFPINIVRKVPMDIPIMLIHSRKDWVIPVNSARRLYIELLETGHQHIYYLELATGEHARLMCGPEADLYQKIVHTFYKKYGLPYNQEYVRNTEGILDHCQPTIQEVKQLMKQKRTPIQEDPSLIS